MEARTTTVKYRDHNITLTDEMLFVVNGPAFDIQSDYKLTFPSLQQAKEKIDNQIKLKGIKEKRRLALPVINSHNGKEETVHGIHSRNGNLLGITESGGYSAPDVFPPVPWIVDLLEEQRRLQKRIGDIHKAIHPFRIGNYRGHKLSDPDKYGNALQELEEEYAKLSKEAKDTNNRMLVKYPDPDNVK